ncbi:MAG: hypothetical protein Q8O59_00220 [bacterium]|nr:hypothetical protein [bacterium]
MFDFFKKKKPEQPETIKEKASEPALKETVKADNIAIHVMPGRFRNQPVKQDSAKTMGLLIIIGGAVVLIAASGALYYFLFRKPEVVITEEPSLVTENQPVEPSQTDTEVNQTDEILDTLIATSTVETTLPSSDEIATTTVATTTPEIAPVEPVETDFNLRIGADGDNDGLTDIEEILLSTDVNLPDTDGDGYPDGSEVINLYNPAGEGKLTANSNISIYENKTFVYDLFYPSTWQTTINGGDDSLMFKSGDNQFVQIIVQPNVNKQTLEAWYMEQLGVLTISEAYRVSGSSWQGIKSPDGLNIYLMDNKQSYIFSLTYNPGGGNVLEYTNIFQMMVKSFTLKE